jgi:oxygen-dependent protoporphyrinogen oxidase
MSDHERHLDVAVVGGGVSGLACGLWLHRAGRSVLVLEASSAPGGCVRTLRHEGWTFELGPNAITDPSGAVKLLCEAAGIAARRREAEGAAAKRYIYKSEPTATKGEGSGRLLALPLSPLSFAASPLLSARTKLGLLREPFIAPAPEDTEESVADFVRRRLGPEFLDVLVGPFVSGIYAGDPERLSIRWAMPRIYELERQHGSLIRGALARRKGPAPAGEPVSFPEGLEELPRAMAGVLGEHFVLDTPVAGLERCHGGFHLEARSRNGLTRRLRADRVILAVPADVAARLLSGLAPEARALGEIPYAPVVSVALGLRDGHFARRLDGFGFLAPGSEKLDLLGCLFSSTLFEGRTPPGCVALTALAGGATRPEMVDLPEGALLERILRDLRRALGPLPDPIFHHVTRWPRAIPQYEVGHGRFVALAAAFERSFPGLHFSGNWLGGISLADCIRNASALCEGIVGGAGEKGTGTADPRAASDTRVERRAAAGLEASGCSEGEVRGWSRF